MTQFLCGKCKNMLPIALKPIGKSTWCKPCHKEYYKQNKARIAERKALLHAQRMQDPEYKKKHNESNASWRKKNPQKARSAKNNWRKRFPEKHVIHQSNRRAKINGGGGTHTVEDILQLLDLQNFKCAYCGKDLEKYHVDHKIPICRGGCNDKSNLAISCPSCNLRKGRKTVEEFIGGYHR